MAINCSRCGETYPDGTRFCMACGNVLMNDKKVKAKDNRTIWIVVVLCIIIAGGSLVGVLVRMVQNDNFKVDWNVATATTEFKEQEKSKVDKNNQENEYIAEENIEIEEGIIPDKHEVEEDVKEQSESDSVDESKETEIQSDWLYLNARFGYSMLIPATFSQSEQEPDNGDGAWFYDKAGACLTVSGYYNVLPSTPESIKEQYPDASYAYAGENYCCVSYVEGKDIVYNAQRVESDLVHGFELRYPKSDKEQYDQMIEDMLNYLIKE